MKAMHDLRDGQSDYSTPFFNPDFACAVSSSRPDVKLIVLQDQSGLAGFWPLHVSRFKSGRGVGAAFSDRNGPILREDVTIDFQKVLQEAGIHHYLTSGLNVPPAPDNQGKLTDVKANVTQIGSCADTFFEQQIRAYPSHFKRLRRLNRKLLRDASVEFYFQDDRDTSFEQLIALKRSQYEATGRHDVLAPSWVQSLISILRHREHSNLKLRLSTLWADGVLIAGELNLEDRQTLHGWIVAYNPAFGRYSPGHLLTERILREMPSHGMSVYDSGVGGDDYKKYVTNHHDRLWKGTIHAAQKRLDVRQAVRSTWSMAEAHAPKKIAQIMSRGRRRTNMILAAEIDFPSRMRGFYQALNTEI